MVAVTPPGEVLTATLADGIAAPDRAEVTTSVYFCIYFSYDREMDLRQASFTLDLTRALAAQAVVIGHALSFFGLYPNIPYIQNVAVQVFFVLSGFLIAHALGRKERFSDYFIDRFARIYSAYIPALLFIAGMLLVFGTLSGKTLLGNVLMLQNFPRKGIPSLDGPLWSLAIEWHIYIFIGAIYFLPKTPSLLLLVIPFSIVPVAFLVRDGDLGVGYGLTALWLYGYLGYFFMDRIRTINPLVPTLALVAYLLLLEQGNEYQPWLYPLLAVAFLCGVSRARTLDSGLVKFLAAYSFTLYLVHHIILSVLSNYLPGWLGFGVGMITTNAVAIALAIPTEMRHQEMANFLKGLFTPLPSRQAPPP
jgi:peptidoglycan/LPS O-acetylase OafA/YrhL